MTTAGAREAPAMQEVMMQDAIERFAEAHFDYHGLTAARQQDVRRALADYRRFAGRPLEDTGADDFGAWLRDLIGRGYHVNTVRKYGNCVRPFYRWAWRDGQLVDAETYMRVREVPNPRGATGKAIPRPYKRKELTAFWAQLDERWPVTPGERLVKRYVEGRSRFPRIATLAMHRQIEAVVHLALHGGLRHSEVYGAGLDDIHPDNEYVVVRGAAKGRRADLGPVLREVPFTEDARAAIGRWLELRAKILRGFGVEHDSPWLSCEPRASLNNPLLPSTPAAPMNRRRFGELMGTIGAWELHRFRHTCGTEWLRAGMPVEKVQRLLGHARLDQTMGYVEVAFSDVQRDARRHEVAFSAAVRRVA